MKAIGTGDGRGRRARPAPFWVGLFALLATVAFAYWAYTRANPFSDSYEFSAVFETANNLKPRSPVRIAGVDVGTVTEVQTIGNGSAARVTMELERRGLPLHEDAELKIRPRIFLEGNFFVDLKPGSPATPVLDEGDEIPVQQTATPVQFADVLAALESDTRTDLQVLLDEYADGLRGKGARGLRAVYRHGRRAYASSALVNTATLGRREHDLSRLVAGQQRTFAALARDERALTDLVGNFNTFAAALSRQDAALKATVPALDRVLRAGMPALESVNDALPALRGFARDALPATRSSIPAIAANRPFVRQARGLFSERELRGLVEDLVPVVPSLVRLDREQARFLEQTRALSACQERVLVPFAKTPIPHPDLPDNTGQPFYKQSTRAFVGLAGESRLYDPISGLFAFNFGSGPYTLVQPGEDGSDLVGTALFPPLGVRPERPVRRPDFRPNVPCETQEPPDMNAVGGRSPTRVVQPNARPSAADRHLLKRSEAALRVVQRYWELERQGKAKDIPDPLSLDWSELATPEQMEILLAPLAERPKLAKKLGIELPGARKPRARR